MRIGVDVGGTNTDAVLMDGAKVLAACKMPTTKNVSDGIVNAITKILKDGEVSPADVRAVMIGTTHFTNAFVQRRELLHVGILRLALPASRALPPMIDWPKDIADAVYGSHYLVKGGYQYDGRINSELDEDAIIAAAREMKVAGIRAVSISGVFSPVNNEMEERAAEIIQDIIPDVAITLSCRLGRIGLLERENAGIMNAALADLAKNVVASFRSALADLNITAPFYISQNDGTLMQASQVEKYPVLTFSSGPTNSMRGAAYLSGAKDALVADIGGTTTDIGMLSNGFPRESSIAVDIGGVRTNFRMPDVFALGLGGGSIVEADPDVRVGPQSVGYRLLEDALVFGGDTVTSSDIAVAAGYADFGDKSKVQHLAPDFVAKAVDVIHAIVTDGVDRMKTSAAEMPLILVGGGSVLINRDIAGTSEVIIPENAGVANAIGASIAQIGGEVDRVYSYENMGREAAIEAAKQEAKDNAIAGGAIPETVEIIDLEELPLAYVPGGSVRLRVKAAGDLKI
ncbi:hydantoinase [Kordiimonas sediminis]|uniref:Hydantoinase n=1 Tax=Kordiimonas sediminis TaxID=1735581 RepID=A0A919AK74_9PROT|nr:hydantoinase/oxoprolinase family protein [Kordiimonas sediminis]GHF13603.1 hydantoinase [Kordiimonas sediminis]